MKFATLGAARATIAAAVSASLPIRVRWEGAERAWIVTVA